MTSGLLSTAYREHVMMLYHNDSERNTAAAEYFNEGLRKGHLCVYASVGAYDPESKWNYSALASRIDNYEENVKQGNLVIVDFKPFFEMARKGDPTLFNQLKSQLETMLKQRIAEGKGDKILAFADAACTLSEQKEFEECVELERWWHNAHEEWAKSSKNITVICPHPASVFTQQATAEAKARIAAVHSLMLQARPYQDQTAQVGNPIRVLVAESDPELLTIYRRYLDSLGLEITTVSSANKCLEAAFSVDNSQGFDMIMVDTRLRDMSGLELARIIKNRLPDQRIIITSTTEAQTEIKEVGITSDDILQKPFSFSKLLALIKPRNK